jgi:transcriptional antiterminator NusG
MATKKTKIKDPVTAKPKAPKKAKAKKKTEAGTETVAKSTHHLIIDGDANENAYWYVVHTYSGHEQNAAGTLKQKVESLGLTHFVKEILIPTQEKIRIAKGKKSTIKEKIFPGYMLVKMELTDDAWLAVRTTAGVTGFVGMGDKPTRLPQHEVDAIKRFVEQKVPKFQASFSEGEAVKIIEGPFADMLGSVNKIDEAKGKVQVLVSIFGRETPVELDFLQVSKI